MESYSQGKIPPQQIEAEQSLLGGCLIDNSAMDEVETILSGDEFYRDSHRVIFSAMKSIKASGVACDLVTLMDYLANTNKLDQVGGAPYLADLHSLMGSADNVSAYAKIISHKSTLRRIISASSTIQASCYDEGGKTLEQIVDACESELFSVTKNFSGRTDNNHCTILDSIKRYVKKTEERIETGRHLVGIPTGFTDLDRYISGFCSEEYIILAARPSVGKTALATALARGVAKQGVKVAIFSAEMGEQITPRMIAQESGIGLSKVRTGQMLPAEIAQFLETSGRLSRLPIEIFCNPAPTEIEIKQQIRRSKPGLAIIDYIGYVRYSEGGDSKIGRERQISGISSCFKGIAREVGIPVIALSQLNREIEKTKRPPMLSDLRDSGSLEQDADIVLFIHSETKEDRWREVLIAKNRNGPCGKFKLTFFPESTEFKSFAEPSRRE